jgi:hypothetical protein
MKRHALLRPMRYIGFFGWCLLVAYTAVWLRTSFDCRGTSLNLGNLFVLALLGIPAMAYGSLLFGASCIIVFFAGRLSRRSLGGVGMLGVPAILGLIVLLVSFIIDAPSPSACTVP